MDSLTVIRRHLFILFAFIATAFTTAQADPINVTYEIGPYSSGGYSASWLHTASGCTGEGPDSGDDLYMCGHVTPASGSIMGILDGGILTVTGGYLHMFGNNYAVTDGQLGGDFTDAGNNLLWFLDIDWFGTFYFESIDMGAGGPNHFYGDEFILWGQNDDAYRCGGLSYEEQKNMECSAWGIDLYAQQVPEPGTLALLGIGLLAMTLVNRRRRFAQAQL